MNQRIRLERIETEKEFPWFAQLVFNEEVMKMNMGRVFTQDEAEGYFSYVLEYNHANQNAGTYKVYLAENDAFIGICSLWVREDGTDVEYMVLPEYWNQGYATQIVKRLIDTARQHPGVSKISGFTDPANVPSKKVLLKNGFAFEKMLDVEEDNSVVEVYSIGI